MRHISAPVLVRVPLLCCRRNYFDSTDAPIYVIDSFDRKRIAESGTELDMILEVSDMCVCARACVSVFVRIHVSLRARAARI